MSQVVPGDFLWPSQSFDGACMRSSTCRDSYMLKIHLEINPPPDPHPDPLFWHTFWHTIWKSFFLISSRIIYTTFFRASYLAYLLTIFLAYLLEFFLGFYLVYLRKFFVVEIRLKTLWSGARPELAVEVWRGTLWSCRGNTMTCACRSSLAGKTSIWRLQLMSGEVHSDPGLAFRVQRGMLL